MIYWFVKIDNRWSKPYTYYPVSKFINSKKNIEIYEVDLDNLNKKYIVWKNEV